jgi:hypothetical protein
MEIQFRWLTLHSWTLNWTQLNYSAISSQPPSKSSTQLFVPSTVLKITPRHGLHGKHFLLLSRMQVYWPLIEQWIYANHIQNTSSETSFIVATCFIVATSFIVACAYFGSTCHEIFLPTWHLKRMTLWQQSTGTSCLSDANVLCRIWNEATVKFSGVYRVQPEISGLLLYLATVSL